MSSSFPFHIKEHTVPGQHIREWARATANSQEDVLNIHVKQYTPKDNPTPQPGDVTILAAHANGFPKELYEALWADLHAQQSVAGSGFRIRGIWIADVSNQGYSGEANEGKLGDDPCWHDHTRDLLHLTNVFRAEMPRPIIGIGHSFGANILTHLSLLHPRLLTSLVLLDPTIVALDASRPSGPGITPARASASRRDVWPSKQAAIESFRRSRFYGGWDPRVLESWIQNSLRELPTALYPELPASPSPSPSKPESPSDPTSKPAGPGATLRTTKHQELFTFLRPLFPHITTDTTTSPPTYTISRSGAPDFDPTLASKSSLDVMQVFPFYRSEGATVFHQLPSVRPSVLFVHGATSEVSPPDVRATRLATCGVGMGGSGGVSAGRVAEVLMEDKGHLFPMEVPADTARHAARWIASEVALWRDEQARYDAWTRLPLAQKTTLSQAFLDKIGRPKGQRPNQKKEKSAEPKL
ncbi:Alpha/beta hydrolase family-domain-containing protein [Xylaria cf. heliscus]|nr:Alpha/beta hydrolase family-domain-containing protein [Xylaria cf. heliscus]